MRNGDFYIGRVFGNYRIKSRIACGSFGCVYLAQHLWLSRIVAIKLLHTVLLHSSLEQKRFRREARILEKLRHPHIVRIYDFGISDCMPYLVIEYASNGSLNEFLKHKFSDPLPIKEAVSIISQIGDALHHANQYGILHHDLKPANILFNSKNEVLLTDFGIAIARITTTIKHPSASTGTPIYMAPEQFLGSVGPTSDQYSLGCLAYELFTGRPPFLAPNAAAIGYLHIHEKPIPPSHLNSDLPLHIEHAILKALEKESINRYEDISGFVTALLTPIPQIPVQVTPKIFRRTAEQQLEEVYRLCKLERYQEALTICDKTLQLNPNYIALYKVKGFLLFKLKYYEEALTIYMQVTSIAPKDSDSWKFKGHILYKLKHYKEAIAAYAIASRFDPENPTNYYNIGHALKLLGWSKEAQLAYEKARQMGF